MSETSWKPKYVVVDYETTGLEYYRHDFRVLTMGIAWRSKEGDIETRFYEGEEACAKALSRLADLEIPLIAHNLQFEMGVSKCRFPNIKLNWVWDTLRLCQNRDGGGNEFDFRRQAKSLEDMEAELDGETPKWRSGLGLEACASRFLPNEYKDHKKPFYDWLKSNGYRNPGENLDKLPPEMLEAYNVADVVVELVLFENCMDYFKVIEFDPSFDHQLYRHRCDRTTDAKIRGTMVNRGWMGMAVHTLKERSLHTVNKFHDFGGKEMLEFEEERMWNFILTGKASGGGKPVSERTADKTWTQRFEKMARENDKWKFNPRSTNQLRAFFMGKLGLIHKFMTKTGEKKKKTWMGTIQELTNQYPSFSAAHLPSWGPGGEILKNLKRTQIVMKQAENLMYLSAYDGRWHIDLKSAGTCTNRLAAGSDYK